MLCWGICLNWAKTPGVSTEVGSYAREKGVDRLYGVGKLAENIFDGFGGDGGYCKEKKDFYKL